jgi:hypothetical protein
MFNFNFTSNSEIKASREILRLKKKIVMETDELEIKKLNQQIKLCEALSWKDYKVLGRGR